MIKSYLDEIEADIANHAITAMQAFTRLKQLLQRQESDRLKEVERLKGEIKHCIDFSLGFALCNSDHAGTRKGIKKAQNFLRELIGEPPGDV